MTTLKQFMGKAKYLCEANNVTLESISRRPGAISVIVTQYKHDSSAIDNVRTHLEDIVPVWITIEVIVDDGD